MHPRWVPERTVLPSERVLHQRHVSKWLQRRDTTGIGIDNRDAQAVEEHDLTRSARLNAVGGVGQAIQPK
jgi:hypothetical protein